MLPEDSRYLSTAGQGAMGLPGTNVVLQERRFSFDSPSVRRHYTGIVSSDFGKVRGIWNQGYPLSLDLQRQTAADEQTIPESLPGSIAAQPPVAFADLKNVIDGELSGVLAHGALSSGTGGGLVIGVLDRGQRSVFSYGTEKRDSIFEIGSSTKTFTGLLLAQMTVQDKVTLDEPVRSLLPAGFVPSSDRPQMTLVDLATQHSGLPRMPDNFSPHDPSNPYADYGPGQLRDFLVRHGLDKAEDVKWLYSNLGFALLGYALSLRADMSYAQLVSTEITQPLHMDDTVVTLSPAQRSRLIQGYNASFDRAAPWDFDVCAGAGSLKSTASDLLTYLEVNLHPEKYAGGAPEGSPAATLPAAMALDHKLRARVLGDAKIALAWVFTPGMGRYAHDGGTGGYSSYISFNPGEDRAVIALYNRDDINGLDELSFAAKTGQNVEALMSGRPTVALDLLSSTERDNLARRAFEDRSIQGAHLPAAQNANSNSVQVGTLITSTNQSSYTHRSNREVMKTFAVIAVTGELASRIAHQEAHRTPMPKRHRSPRGQVFPKLAEQL